ncbi:hypothetical protein L6164_020949 [Bauhinia variegata]|uniref:Uncharacterized protein n=1 Tax=Bauhinia variegata TaxID=167791 RepID=A0ACB9MX67_BAUVA|nr:hypothetical protein L6164_020949 [Bauhinia variegata]
MIHLGNLLLYSLLLLSFSFISTHAAKFQIYNNCSYTVWAAATPSGGGRRLDPHKTWRHKMAPGTAGARIWGRTGCSFDRNGLGHCQTGDCPGGLSCTGWSQAPNTLAEFSLNQGNNLDFYDISLLDGFNIPMGFYPLNGNCHGITCATDLKDECPKDLRSPGGCNSACTVYRSNEYCCYDGNCGPTKFSKFFKQKCQDAYSYPKDVTSTFACPGGTDYKVVFCP